eukprot:Gb_34904 [translate_table: standard]
MGRQSVTLIVGISIGVTIGVVLATFTLLCIRLRRRRSQVHRSSNDQRGVSLPIRINGVDSSQIMSDAIVHESSQASKQNGRSSWWGLHEKNFVPSASGIPKYSYKDLQKATHNFTTVLGKGAFGPVYKATMPTGEIVAVKVLATDSKQGEREFQNEVLLLGRLHHRNLVNLVGYCVDKGQRMLVYEFMSNGSLATHLYNEDARPLSWEERVHVAQDVSRGVEYLHDGAVPSVVHRDIKSANILLDHFMRARVADFGLSKEEIFDGRVSGLKGTYGYMDPEYMSTNTFTKKSDVYSFGIFLFELITGRNPQQGLMDYVNLAAISADGKTGWEEILDSRLNGKCNIEEVGSMAALAYKCVQKIPRKRPSMRDVSQALSKIQNTKPSREHHRESLPVPVEENSEVVQRIGLQIAELKKLANITETQEV